MAVVMRLARHGRKGRPFYRLVVADSRSPRDGKHIKKLGTYDPICKDREKYFSIDNPADIEYWLSCGAQPTERVVKLLKIADFKLPQKIERKYSVKFAARKDRISKKDEKGEGSDS